MNWFIHNQGVVGIILSAIATLVASFASVLKSKGDYCAKSAAPGEKFWPYFWWSLLTLVCVSVSALGGWFSKQSGEAALKLSQTSTLEMRSEMNDLRNQLKLGNHTTSLALTEAKMQALQDQLSDFAHNSVGKTEEKRQQISEYKSKLAEERKRMAEEAHALRIQQSAEFIPIYSFALRFTQETLRAFADASGKTNLDIIPIVLPDSIYTEDLPNTTLARVQVTEKVAWQFEINDGPCVVIKFMREGTQLRKREDRITLQLNADKTKINVTYESDILVPDPSKISGEYDAGNYEALLKPILMKVVEAQWIDAE
jgi:hypothetical protein